MRHLMLFLMLSACLYAKAQVSKGSFLVSGNISLKHSKNTGDSDSYTSTSNIFTVAPKVGYFVIDRLCIGASLPLSWGKYTSKTDRQFSDYDGTLRSYGVGPFVRYYIPLQGRLYLLGDVGYTWDAAHTRLSNYVQNGNSSVKVYQEANMSSGTLKAGAGMSYFINKNIGVELLVNYSRTNSTKDDVYKYSGLLMEAGFQIYLGN